MPTYKLGDTLIYHKTGESGKIVKYYYWEHSGFEMYVIETDERTIAGDLSDFARASIPQLAEGIGSNPI